MLNKTIKINLEKLKRVKMRNSRIRKKDNGSSKIVYRNHKGCVRQIEYFLN